MIALSSQCLAIANAIRSDSLRLDERQGRFGPFVAVCDGHGTIEVADTLVEANARISAIRGRLS